MAVHVMGSIPDKDAAPVVRFIARAREEGLGPERITYNDLLYCLLVVGLGLAD